MSSNCWTKQITISLRLRAVRVVKLVSHARRLQAGGELPWPLLKEAIVPCCPFFPIGHTLDAILRAVKVMNPQGFHARPAHLFVKLASQYQCQVEIVKGNEVINGKSILDLLTLGAGNGTTLTLRALGPDAEDAVAALAQLVENGFGEAGPAPSH